MNLRLIAGLGNPGHQYRESYHNIGYRVVDFLRRRYGASESAIRPGTVYEVDDAPIAYLAKPDCYVNQSGGVIKQWVDALDLSSKELLVVYDDFSLDVGEIRLRPEGSAGGHNGMKSITDALSTTTIPRLRIGIGPLPDGVDPADFVLSPVQDTDREVFDELNDAIPDLVTTLTEEGMDEAMSRFNGSHV